MRLFTVIRNDREPQSVKAEKFKTDSKDYIFSKYDPASTYYRDWETDRKSVV